MFLRFGFSVRHRAPLWLYGEADFLLIFAGGIAYLMLIPPVDRVLSMFTM